MLLESLGLYRNVRIGALVGVGVAVAAYLFRFLELWGPVADGREYPIVGPEGWFLLLAFVLAVTVAMLTIVSLTVRNAVRKAQREKR